VIGAVTPVGYSGPIIRQIKMVPVAAPQHALVKNRDQVSELELRGYRQVVLRDTGTRREQDAGWLQAEKRWTVSHFSTSIQMLKAGLAFGFLPEDWVRSALAEGSLKRIPLQQTLERRLPLYLMLADRQAAGPATRALNQLIADAAAPPL
jgi:Transcriptional regulator